MKRLILSALVCAALGASVATQTTLSAASFESKQQAGRASQTQTQTRPATTPPQAAVPPRPGAWWSDDPIKKELGLTPEQVKNLDRIWANAKDELAAYNDAYNREKKELDRLIAESKVEQWVILRQIDKAETQRSGFNKLRIMTIYRMHRELTPDQRVKLTQITERDKKDAR